MVFIADDLGSWLIGGLADAGRKRLVTWVLGDEQDRALRQAAKAALRLTAEDLCPETAERAEELAMVVSEVFSAEVPDARLTTHRTLLQGLQAGIAAQLAPLGDPSLTGTGKSSADALGISAAVLAEKLTGHLVQEITLRGARGGTLAPLASQLNHDATYLQGQRLERMLERLTDIVLGAPPPSRRAPVGWPIGDLGSPVALGVHRAVAAGHGGGNLPELPPYVPRAHDETLCRLVEEAEHGSKFVVVIGDSSTGKTRALWESLQRLPFTWRLWRPSDARVLHDGLTADALAAQTVVWLDDAHDYLSPGRTPLAAANAAALRQLVADPGQRPVLVAATMWPHMWQALTQQSSARPDAAQDRSPDAAQDRSEDSARQQVAELLDMADCVTVPGAFTGSDLAAARSVARHDARLARALQHAPAGRLTQYLAGALRQLEFYESAPQETRALIDAAIDARRFGHRRELPAAMLLSAAPGYIDERVWDHVGGDWAGRAVKAASRSWRGLDGPLSQIRPRPGQAEPSALCYRLADVLEQAGTTARRHAAPPQSFWDAIAQYGHPDDLPTLAAAAFERGRYRNAMILYTKAARTGDARALNGLAWMRELAGDHDEADRLAAKAAAAGSPQTLSAFAVAEWRHTPRKNARRLLRMAAEAGDTEALAHLAGLREQAGNQRAAEKLWETAANAGDRNALIRLAELREQAGRHEDADQLAFKAASRYLPALWELVRQQDRTGTRAWAERLALKAADAIDTYFAASNAPIVTYAMQELAVICARTGTQQGQDAAERLAVRATGGGRSATSHLARKLEEMGRHREAEHFAVHAAEADRCSALTSLASMREKAGNDEDAMRLYRIAAEAGSGFALGWLAERCERAGDRNGAEQLAIKAAQAGRAADKVVSAVQRAGSRRSRA